MLQRWLFVVFVFVGLLCCSTPRTLAGKPAPPPPLQASQVLRAVKVAHWLYQRNPPRRPFLSKGMPLLLLSRWLPAMARVGQRSTLQALHKAAPKLGYSKNTPQMYTLWHQEWQRVLLALDAHRWNVQPSHHNMLQKQLRALPTKKLTPYQKRFRAALRYKLRLSQVSRNDQKAVVAQKRVLLQFLKPIWRHR
ncbi:MAG: hypothetical protein EP343_30135 [Deltaproteobacteria bacterium]|nr:MAG: hypothetical protein EP343_30135 [Deltaproteobacteria bacterium]